MPEALRRRYLKNHRNVPPEDHLPFGEELFRALFATKPRREKLDSLLAQNEPFVIRLRTESHFLHDLPWELLWRPGDGQPLLLTPEVALVRSLPEEGLWHLTPAKPPYRLLVILSLPLPTYEKAPLDPLRELKKIYRALEPWLSRDLVKVEVTVKANEVDLRNLFARKKFDILHFIGHGGAGGELILEGNPSEHPEPYRVEKLVTGGEAATLFQKSGARVAILNACYTASPEAGLFTFSPGLAQALHLGGVPLVMANQSSVADEKAIELTEHLYRILLGSPDNNEDTLPLLHLLSPVRSYLGGDFWRPVVFAAPGLEREGLFQPPEQSLPVRAKPLRRLLGLKQETPFYVYRFRPLREIIHRLVHEERKLLVLHGLGGAGKSFLADYAADFLASEFRHVLALDLREFGSGRQIAAKVAAILAEERLISQEQAQEISGLGPLSFWREVNRALKNTPWLLVLDNFEEFQEKELPRAGFVKDEFLRELFKVVQSEPSSGRVVLTTRLLPYLDRAMRRPLEAVVIGAYNEGEQTILRYQVAHLLKGQEGAFESLAEEVGWHPLSLGLWLEKPMELERLLKRAEIRQVLDFYRDYLKTFPREARALAFFPEPFSQEFLARVLKEEPDVEDLFVRKLCLLEEIRVEEKVFYRLFPVIKLYFFSFLAKKDPTLLIELYQRLEDFEADNPRDAFNLVHLLEEVSGLLEGAEREKAESLLANLSHNFTLLYQQLGRFEEAEEFYKKALEIFEKISGKDHPLTAATYNNLALLYQQLGRFNEAEAFFKKALEIREDKLGKDHPLTAAIYHYLAGLYLHMGRFEEAEKFLKKALEIREDKLGLHPHYFDTALALSLVALKIGHKDLAVETLCQTLKNLRYWEFKIKHSKNQKVGHLLQSFVHYALHFIILGEALGEKITSEACRENLKLLMKLLKEKFPIPETLREEISRQLGLGPDEEP